MIKIAIKAVKEAGKILLNYYGNIKENYKGIGFDVGNVVTKADLESEERIMNILKEKFPNHNFYGEEKIREDNKSEYTWYVDPLDGTSNFSRNIPLFGISIGLVKGDKPVLGILFFPVLNLLIYAEKNKGAFANGKRINVSNRDLKNALYYSGGYYNRKLGTRTEILNKIGFIKIIDASSFEFAQIAMGDAELYILTNVLHDVAAGVIIVQEAGGKVTDYNGKEWKPNSIGIVASNKKIHNEVIRILNINS